MRRSLIKTVAFAADFLCIGSKIRDLRADDKLVALTDRL
jgi:hypothetical protein